MLSCSLPSDTAIPGKPTQDPSLSSGLRKAASPQAHVTTLILTPALMEILKTCLCIHTGQGHTPREQCMPMWLSELQGVATWELRGPVFWDQGDLDLETLVFRVKEIVGGRNFQPVSPSPVAV